MELKFIKSEIDYIIESEPFWGTIIFTENNNNIVEISGNILKFREWLYSNRDKILSENFFYSNPPASLSKRLFYARTLDFYSNDFDENLVFDYWHNKIFEYYKSHGVVFGLRGENVKPYIIGLNGEYGEISHYDPEVEIDFCYQFDLFGFFEKLKDFSIE